MAGDNDKWEMYEDKRGEHRWRRTASNGKIVGKSSEGYVKRPDCKANAQRHGMDGNPKGLGSSDKWDVYQDKRGEWRWRRAATNGEITGASSEGYVNKSDSKSNAQRNGMS
jgi:uncharacterized protein YegP (UPF0339 family)